MLDKSLENGKKGFRRLKTGKIRFVFQYPAIPDIHHLHHKLSRIFGDGNHIHIGAPSNLHACFISKMCLEYLLRMSLSPPLPEVKMMMES